MRILVLGASGMLGSALFRILSDGTDWTVYGTVRNSDILRYFNSNERARIIRTADVLNQDELSGIFARIKPDLVVNCIGIIKQQKASKDPLVALPVNAMFPHRLSLLCELIGARLILISTDCVFNGKKGMYVESDIPDAEDLYGKSKEIGEVADKPHVFTIRTSIVGHELNSNNSLINWFLSQEREVKGYTSAIFSGLPTCELAEIIRDFIVPKKELNGLYHISSDPISKHDLLILVNRIYKKNIRIVPSEEVRIDRSLDSKKFRESVSFHPDDWELLVLRMKNYHDKYLDAARV